MAFPIIRIEVEHMKHAIQVAMSDYMVRMDQEVKAAIEQVCTPENVQGIVLGCVQQALFEGVRKEVDNFFKYGEGRKIVADAVRTKLLSDFTNTPLDGV